VKARSQVTLILDSHVPLIHVPSLPSIRPFEKDTP
jgi:hypothetical protein